MLVLAIPKEANAGPTCKHACMYINISMYVCMHVWAIWMMDGYVHRNLIWAYASVCSDHQNLQSPPKARTYQVLSGIKTLQKDTTSKLWKNTFLIFQNQSLDNPTTSNVCMMYACMDLCMLVWVRNIVIRRTRKTNPHVAWGVSSITAWCISTAPLDDAIGDRTTPERVKQQRAFQQWPKSSESNRVSLYKMNHFLEESSKRRIFEPDLSESCHNNPSKTLNTLGLKSRFLFFGTTTPFPKPTARTRTGSNQFAAPSHGPASREPALASPLTWLATRMLTATIRHIRRAVDPWRETEIRSTRGQRWSNEAKVYLGNFRQWLFQIGVKMTVSALRLL